MSVRWEIKAVIREEGLDDGMRVVMGRELYNEGKMRGGGSGVEWKGGSGGLNGVRVLRGGCRLRCDIELEGRQLEGLWWVSPVGGGKG